MSESSRLLIVDDEELNRDLLEGMVECLGHESITAEDGHEALKKLTPDIDLVLCDVMMPGMTGYEVVQHIRQDPARRDIPVIMVTALTEKADRLRAVESGANDFITKPIDSTELRVRLGSLLKVKAAQDSIKRQQAELEDIVAQRTRDLCQALVETAQAQQTASEAHLDTVHRLALAAEYRDNDTATHIHRVGHYCALLARGLGLPPDEIDLIRRASPMHDVGKLGVPDSVLLKPGKLEPEEFDVIKHHTVMGARILSGSSSTLLQAGELIALSHHEKWDGTGYPNGLAGEDIPLYGRICAVADVFDALTSKRPYKDPFPNEKACEIMREGRGKHFDPKVLDLFFAHMDEVVLIQERYRDE